MQGNSRNQYAFLLPSFHEYLTASYLARQAKEVGFDGGEVISWERGDKNWTAKFAKIDRAYQEAEYSRLEAESHLSKLENLIATFDHMCWKTEWREVFLFLAGSLEDPVPLLDLLSDQSRDDMFRHRLALAAECLPEIDMGDGV